MKAYLQENHPEGKQLSDQSSIYSDVELVAQYLFRQLIAAIAHLHHQLNIIHRDLKPDNILFCSQNAEIKLTDFTVARGELTNDARLYDSEGTPCFTAPECHVVE